jgi:hypothetical protein
MIGSTSLPVVVRCKSGGYESAGWDPTLGWLKAELERLRYRIESMVRKDGGAVLATTNWTVTGSASQGRAMVESANRTRSRLGQRSRRSA